jgi:ABC-type methionine transport system ATPase subunit
MARKQVLFTFPRELIREPVIHDLSHNFKVVTNIRRADVAEDRGWVMLELEGDTDEIDNAIAWARARGVRVDSIGGDLVEG